MQVRWTGAEGLKAGQVVEVEDAVGRAYINAGRAVPVEVELTAEQAEVQETPEQPKRRTGAKSTPPSAPEPEPETR